MSTLKHLLATAPMLFMRLLSHLSSLSLLGLAGLLALDFLERLAK